MILKLSVRFYPTAATLTLILLYLAGCAPRAIVTPAKKGPGIFHVVKPGENLSRIAQAYGVSTKELARVNQLRDAHQIRPGQRIFVPAANRQLPVEVITPTDVKHASRTSGDGRAPALNGFLWPVYGPINSRFGPRGITVHDGIDIAAPEGTPIFAAEGGEVIYSDQLRGYGNLIIMRHAGGFVSVYAHNQVNLVREGQTVSRGEIIAKVGSTGRVTGPHLHFEIRKDNVAQDPLLHLPDLFNGQSEAMKGE
jgi:murein DD-endopeptidase MepM/ murein hydrolase activator NlpD